MEILEALLKSIIGSGKISSVYEKLSMLCFIAFKSNCREAPGF